MKSSNLKYPDYPTCPEGATPPLRLWLICLLMFAFGFNGKNVSAQAVLGLQKLKDFKEEGVTPYPYAALDYQGGTLYASHDPALALGGGDIIQVWQPDKISARARTMQRYNVFMEPQWEADLEFELERYEHISHMYEDADSNHLVLVSVSYKWQQQAHQLRAWFFDLDSGAYKRDTVLLTILGKEDRELFLTQSPDKSLFLCFSFLRDGGNKRSQIVYDKVLPDEQVGFRVQKTDGIQILVLDKKLQPLQKGLLQFERPQTTVQQIQIDNQGRISVIHSEKKGRLFVDQYPANLEALKKELVYETHLDRFEMKDFYRAMLQPEIDEQGRLFLAFARRETRGKDRGLKELRVVGFDFEKGIIDTSRTIDVGATLQVGIQKQREQFGLKAEKRMEHYALRDVYSLPDGTIWLMTQKHTLGAYHAAPTGQRYQDMGQRIEEIVLYQFSPEGKLRQALVIPNAQLLQKPMDRVSQGYAADFDPQTQELRLLFRESSGDELKGPDRLYFRRVHLGTYEVSDRTLLFEGRRRSQYFLKPYTQWSNQDIVTFMLQDGDDGTYYTISVNVAADPEASRLEEKWWK